MRRPPDAVPPVGLDVPRETRERLAILVREVERWQSVRNLVARSTLPDLWTRHVADSLQLAPLGPPGGWTDLGSGGGFPGLVVAIARPDVAMRLVESDSRKCAFLRHAARETGTTVEVREGRIERVLSEAAPPTAVVMARALADLTTLLGWADPLLTAGAIGLFPKGRGYAAELTRAGEAWRFTRDILPSRTDPEARILRITGFAGRI